MFLATVFLLGMQTCVKALSHLPAGELVAMRSLSMVVLIPFLLKGSVATIFGKNRKLLALRGIIGTGGVVFSYYAIQRLPLATSVSVLHLTPLLSSILAIFLLKERMVIWHWLGFGMAIAGVVFIKGFDPRVDLLPFASILFAALCASGAYNIVRMLRHTEHPLSVVFYLAWISFVAGILLSIGQWTLPQGSDWLILALMSLCTMCYQILLTHSLSNDTVARVMPVKFAGVILAVIAGFFFFGEELTWGLGIGIGLILLGVVLNLKSKNT